MRKLVSDRVKHYAKYAGISIFDSATSPLYFFSYNRDKLRDEKRNFFEEVIDYSSFMTLTGIWAGMAMSQPAVLMLLTATNSISLSYEIGKFWDRHLEEDKTAHGKDSRNEGSSGLLERVGTSVSEKLRTVARKIAVHGASYALVGSMAIAHHFATRNHLSESFDAGQVNVQIRDCEIDLNGSKHKFYLAGEAHMYNASSCRFIGEFIDKARPNSVLSEGVQIRSEQEPSISEYLYSIGMIPLQAGSGFIYSGPRSQARDREIPLEFLESFDKDGVRGGISKTSNFGIGAIGAGFTLLAPFLYFTFVPMQHFPQTFNLFGIKDYSELPEGESFISRPFVRERNTLMVERMLDYMKSHPEETPLVVVGRGHIRGMLDILDTKGKVLSRPMGIEEIMGAAK